MQWVVTKSRSFLFPFCIVWLFWGPSKPSFLVLPAVCDKSLQSAAILPWGESLQVTPARDSALLPGVPLSPALLSFAHHYSSLRFYGIIRQAWDRTEGRGLYH